MFSHSWRSNAEPLLRIHTPIKSSAWKSDDSRHASARGSHAYRYEKNSNRLRSVTDETGTHNYRYDEAGNPLQIASHRFEYDSSGRVIELYDGQRLIAQYRYNFWGERAQKIVYSAGQRHVTTFIYEQQKLIAEANERGTITREYIYVDHHPVAMMDNGETFWIHTDHLGTPIAVTNEQRTIVWSADQRPFGEAAINADPDRNQKTFTLNLRFPGQYADDESGIHYNYFRDYDPRTGRYLTPDPLGTFDGTNSFAYVHGNPMSGFDSLGLYDEMIHYYMTYFLGLVAGLPQDVARTMAIASQYVDENFLTQPIHAALVPNAPALPLYHFVLDYDEGADGDSNDNRFLRFQNPQSEQLNNLLASTDPSTLRDLWVRAHPTGVPGLCPIPSMPDINNARYQLYGEYLHSYQDAFAHRDAYNMSYGIESNGANTPVAWTGHAGPGIPDWFGHAPDNTYNQNYRSPSRCTVGSGRGSVVVQNLSREECVAREGRGYVPANDDDLPECEVQYALGGHPITQGITEAECTALGQAPGAVGSTYRPGSGQIWAFNELRTLRMEYEVFTNIQRSFASEISTSGASALGWSEVAGLPDWDLSNPLANARIGLQQSFEEWASEQRLEGQSGQGAVYNMSLVLQQYNASSGSEEGRLAILNDWLQESGFRNVNGRPLEIELWDDIKLEAPDRRNSNVGWVPAQSFDGVLLPKDYCGARGCR
jgi:RHS repeat-associated protein